MTHIMKINEGFSTSNQERFFRNLIEEGNIGVLVTKATDNSIFSQNEIVENIDNFMSSCDDMCEKCNGTKYISLGEENNTYNVTITDENDEMYASVDFMILYYNEDMLEFLNRIY